MASLDDQYDAALDLLRRVNPRNVAGNLSTLCQQNQELAEELLSTVDQPLQVRTDPDTGKPFLCCDYNRDGDSFRSPHSNKFVPPIEDAVLVPERLRKLEVTANDAFDSYRELYYEGGLASCYLWEQDEDENSEKADKDSFSGIVLFQKHQTQSRWDSVHVFEVSRVGGSSQQFTYRLTSTVMLDIGAKLTNMSGNLTRQAERTLPVAEVVDHVANVGTMVEEMENKLRSLLHEVYFGKTRDVIGDIRSVDNLDEIRAEELQKKAVIDSYSK